MTILDKSHELIGLINACGSPSHCRALSLPVFLTFVTALWLLWRVCFEYTVSAWKVRQQQVLQTFGNCADSHWNKLKRLHIPKDRTTRIFTNFLGLFWWSPDWMLVPQVERIWANSNFQASFSTFFMIRMTLIVGLCFVSLDSAVYINDIHSSALLANISYILITPERSIFRNIYHQFLSSSLLII